MTTLTEGRRAGEFLLSEGNRTRSRDTVTLLSSGSAVELEAGTVLAQIDVGAATAAAKTGGNTGNGTITMDATTPVLAGAKPGIYTVRCIAAATNGGTFRLEDPDGDVIADAAITGGAGGAVAFAEQVKFVITDAGTDFIVGDGFDITVAAGSGKWTPFLNAANREAGAILFDTVTVPASGDLAVVAITRDAEVKADDLVYDSSLSGGALTAAKAAAAVSLAAAGIIIR